jgi:hypothetical protein
MTKLTFTLTAVIALSTTVALGGEWIIFSEELPPGADLALRGDSQFVVSNSHPYQGVNHLERDFATWGSWAWITGIMNLNLDLSGIDFDTAYIEFYIDSGTIPIGYLELRLGGAAWDPDFQNTSVRVDDQPGYQLVKVMLKDFTGTSSGVRPTNLDEFTGGTGMIDRISWGFDAAGDLFIDEVRILDAAGGVTSIASHPVPAQGQADVARDAVLGWTPGQFAQRHNVYLGTSFDDVNTADLSQAVSQGQTGTTFQPTDLLEYGQTYYWRVDEVNAAPSNTVFTGGVWSFTAEPYAYPLTPIAATASSFEKATTGPANTINGSGLTGDLHGTSSDTMWNTAFADPGPIWIQYEFDTVYQLYELWVWNHNTAFEPVLGYGFKDVTIETSTDGTVWTVLKDVQFEKAPAMAGYAHNTTVALDGATARYVRLTAQSNWSTVGLPQYGLSEVRFFSVPVQARAPQPAQNAAGVAVDSTLDWRPGREATSHQVFFGTDQAAVADGTATAETVTSHRFDPGALDFGTTYYWKVDEIGATTYPGALWSFTTQEYTPVEDFESYTDDEGNRIYEAWIDGWTNNTGSVVGYLQSPFAETTIVHGGRQSMPLEYNNGQSPFYSETERTFDTAQNWTANGADSLSLWVQGVATNSPSDLYVIVEDSAGKTATVTNATAVTSAGWTLWVIPQSDLVGVNMAKVKKMTLGVGSRTSPIKGGTGLVYIDDIGYGRPLP